MSRRGRRESLRARAVAFGVSAGVVVVTGLLAFGGGEGVVADSPTKASGSRGERELGGSVARPERPASEATVPIEPPPPTPTATGPRSVLALGHPNRYEFSFGRMEPRAGLLFDLDSGEVLWRRNAFRTLPIASLTKLMTALIVVNKTRPGDRVRIQREMREVAGSAVGLPLHKRIRVESLLAAMLIQSGNDAALALADAAEGSIPRFVDQMNTRARRIGLGCSRFVTPHGLESANRSCAADLAVLATQAMERQRIAAQVRKPIARVPFPIKGGKLNLASTNPLVRMGYKGAIGLKTGYTVSAGRSLIAVVKRQGRTLAAVLIDSPDPSGQAQKLFDRVFAAGRKR